MDRLTSWWVRAFFRWFSESAYHSTHDITPSSHQLFLSIWPLEALGRSLVPPKTGSTFLPCTSAQMIPIISQEVLGESMWNHVKLKTKGLWYRKQWSYSDTVFTSEFLYGEKGNALNNDPCKLLWLFWVWNNMSSVITALMMSNPEVQANWRKMYPSPMPAIPRRDDNRKHLINSACFDFDDQTNCHKKTTQISYIYACYVSHTHIYIYSQSCGRLLWSHSNYTISNWKAVSCRPSWFLHCLCVLLFALHVFIVVKSQLLGRIS